MENRNSEHNVLERILDDSEDPKELPLHILESITENFSEQRIIGRGGFGVVYKGDLRNGCSVAVKRIDLNRYTVNDELFKRELQSLLKISSHRNVVRFLGFCSDTQHVVQKIGSEILLPQKRERLLCFEYISHGSLDKYITDELRGLQWDERYQIIKGICEGLRYLHIEKQIKHMDLKPANIMVHSHMVPKITDFGLSRVDEKSRTNSERFVSRIYCAPEYEKDGVLLFESDMYSLGVIIIEMVTGHKGISNKKNVLRKWKARWNELVRNTSLQAQQVTKCIEIAESCMQKEPKRRPSICHVIHDLNEIGNTNGHISTVGQASLSSDDDMLWIKPVELRFAFEFNRQISCLVELTNMTGNHVAFTIETLSQLLYRTEPNKGIVLPRFKRTVKITLQAQETTPRDMDYPVDEFIMQSIKVKEGLEDEDITEHMFNIEFGKVVDEVNLTVVFVCGETEKLLQVDPSLEYSLAETNVPVSKDDDTISRSYQDVRGQCTTTRLNFNPPQRTTSVIEATNIVSYPRRESARAVDLMTGAMGSLLPKLGQLLDQGHNLQMTVQKDVESLERQLKSMHAALCSVSEVQQDQLDPQDKHWANEVRELSYDIEDVVDDLLVCVEGRDRFGGLIHKMFNLIKNWGNTRYHIAPAIRDIKARVKEVADMRDGNKVGSFVANNKAATSTSIDPRLLALYKDQKELVGIDGTRDELAKRLTGGDDVMSKQLKIISIFGPGGLGKTTLAKAVYDRLHANFRLKAFVSVGRNPDMKEVLEGILLKLDKEKYADIHNKNWKTENLIDELQDVLKNKRYLIVIDDIWDITSWEIIKCALINNDQRSRIITTSRIFEVAENSGEVCQLEPLSDDHSKELFYARLSGGKGACTFDQPDEQSTKILQKCGGVPLAIITIASLLAGKPREDWPKVYSSIGFGDEDNRVVENTRKILLFSYYDLPCYLKTCLLYISTFPEDHEIEKDTLVWKWVAEGFVCEEQGKALFKVGERYFNVLINRSMIQPVGGESDSYTIYACRVHDMVLDMIRFVAKKENFVTILDRDDQNLSSERNVRRLAVHKRVVKQHDLANTSTYRSFNATRSRLSLMPLLPSFKVLRVLSIEYCTLTGDNGGSSGEEEMEEETRLRYSIRLHQQQTDDHPRHLKNNLPGLLHLRYVGLCGTPDCCELPIEIGHLRFLQTLDLRGSGVKTLPQSLIQLTQLKCLRSEDSARRLPDGMGNLTCLEDLRLRDVVDSPNFVKELGKLTQLRVLHITTRMFSDSLNTALVESLSKLQKIEELKLRDGGGCNEPNWDGFSPSPRLCNLRLHNISHSRGLPMWINPSILRNLTKLNVIVKSAKARDLDILGSLPELQYLCLFINEDRVFPDAIAAGAFPKLRYCYMYSPLTYVPGAMRSLESVRFSVNVRAFKDANFDLDFDSFKYLPLLEKVHAQIYRWDVKVKEVEEVEAAVRHAVNNHSNRPILVLEHVGSCTDESPTCPWQDEQTDVSNQEIERLLLMVQAVLSNDPNMQLEATTQFRMLLTIERTPGIEEAIISTGVVPRFIEFLTREDHPQLQFEAAWALSSIAVGTPENTKLLVESGAVPIFVKLLNSHSEDVCQQAVWALGIVAGDSPNCRDLVLDHGGLFPLLQQLNEHAKLSMLRSATRTLSNFCRGKPDPIFDQVKPALSALQHLIHSEDVLVLTDACQALSYLSDGTNEKIQAVIESGVLPRLVELLRHPWTLVVFPALRTVCNIVAGDDLQTQCVIDHQALPCLLNLLTTNHEKSIKIAACLTIAHITAGNREQIEAVINANIIGPLVHLLQTAEFDIKKEAAWAISNAASGGTHDQVKYLVALGCIKPLCDLLVCPEPRIVTVCLEGLENILKVGEAEKNHGAGDVNVYAQMVDDAGGLDKIESLQIHDNTVG